MIAEAGQLVGKEVASRIEESGIQSVLVRSVLTCESRRGICALALRYHRNLQAFSPAGELFHRRGSISISSG